MIPNHAINMLVSEGYLIIAWFGLYVTAIKKLGSIDRYITFKYVNDRFLIT